MNLRNLFHGINVRAEVLSGLTVAFALVPEAVAFAFVAGVEPLVGLYAAFMVGLITSIFGGRPGMISGATGALAVVMVELVSHHGVEYLFGAVVLMGIIQITVGLLKLGKFARFIPHTVMIGFVNGLAIVIFLAQLDSFKTGEHWLPGSELFIMIGLVLLTMAIIFFLPKLTKKVPASLVGILAVTVLVNVFGINTRTVGDIASVSGGLPTFSIPNIPFNIETLNIILPYALILAAIGLIESLMTLELVDDITETVGNSNKECVGQGVANIVTGFFGGMGGCAMIGQSMINVNSGGRSRLSGITAALFLLSFILFGSTIIEIVPVAALTGVMFMVVIATFEWLSFKIIKKIPKEDALVIIVVTVVTVFTDLALAVGIGIILSSLVHSWQKGEQITVTSSDLEDGSREYVVDGHIFFASTKKFVQHFDIKNDPEKVVVCLKNSKVVDYSSLEAINMLTERYKKAGKKLYFKHLSDSCQDLITAADELVNVNVISTVKNEISVAEIVAKY